MRLEVSAGQQNFTEDAVFIAGRPTRNAIVPGVGANIGFKTLTQYIWRNDFDVRRRVRIRKAGGVNGADTATRNWRFGHTFDDGYRVAEGYYAQHTTARVYRIVGGVVQLVRTAPVVDHGSTEWRLRQTFSGPSCNLNLDTRYRNGVPVWFAVYPYDAAGNFGPISNAVSVTTPSSWSGQYLTGTEAPRSIDNMQRGDTGALGAPTISIAADWSGGTGMDSVTVTVTTPASGSPEGYLLVISPTDPAGHRGDFVTLEAGGTALQAGDMIILDRVNNTPFAQSDRSAFWWNQNGENSAPELFLSALDLGQWPADAAGRTWRLQPHNGGGYTGLRENYLEITLSTGQSGNFGGFMFIGTGSNNYDDYEGYEILRPGRTYRAQVWARSDAARSVSPALNYNTGGEVTLTVTAINDSPASTQVVLGNGKSVLGTWNLTTTWQLFSVEFEVDAVASGSIIGSFEMTLSGAARFDFSEFGVFNKAAGGVLKPTPEELARFQGSKIPVLRQHMMVKTVAANNGYDARRLILDWLHPSLEATVAAGIPEFWFQPEFYLSEADWAGLVEYLFAADGTGDWTALRASLGRIGPWIDDFRKLYWELSNETWNTMEEFANFPDVSADWYGRFQQYVIDLLKSNGNWTTAAESKTEFVIGGHVFSAYGETAAERTPDSKWVTHAPYIGGWEQGETVRAEQPAGYNSLLFFTPTFAAGQLATIQSRAAQSATARGVPISLGTYEDGPGYALPQPGFSQNDLARTTKSRAGGVAMFDKMMALFRAGFQLQCYFTMDRGDTWSSHQSYHVGDAAYPDWQWAELFNDRCADGLMLETFNVRVPLRLVQFDADEVYPDTPEVDCYVMANGTRRSVILVNRNLPWNAIDSGDALYDASDTGARTVRVRPSWSSATTLTRHHMIGAYNAQNFDSSAASYADLSITATPLGAHSGDLVVTLPAASAEVYIFEEVS